MFAHQELINEMPKLEKFARKLTRNESEASDLTQSTLLRALEKADYFQTGTDLFKWSSKIMYNIFVTEYRRKTKFESQYDPELQIANMSVDAEQENKSEVAAMGRAMAHLSEEHKEVLIMVCVKGMQYQEVAEVMNIPVGTVRSRLSRARAQLIALMDGEASPHYAPSVDEMYQYDTRKAA